MNQNLEMFIKGSVPTLDIDIVSDNGTFTHSYVKLANGRVCSLVYWKAPKYCNKYTVVVLDNKGNMYYDSPIAGSTKKDLSEADVLKYLKQISELPNEHT
jgi:hypothetical protein